MANLYPLLEVVPHSFIYAVDNAIPKEQCAKMIEHFENNPEQQYVGRVGANRQQHQSIKKSTDLLISGRPEWENYNTVFHASMQKAIKSLAAIHPFFRVNRFKTMGYNVQRTVKGEYYRWHIDGGSGEFSQRVLVAIWYLNDVPGPGGATEFHHQNISIQPQVGRLVLFPPFWTHLHQNSTLQQGVKYIATAWLTYA